MPVVATHRARPTDVLASDVWSPSGSMLCAKGTMLTEHIVQRLLQFGVEMVHVTERDEEPENVSKEQVAEFAAAVENRFQEVQGDRFLMRLKNAVLSTIISHTDGEIDDDEEPEFDLEAVTDVEEQQKLILEEMQKLVDREQNITKQVDDERQFARDREDRLRDEVNTQIQTIKRDAELRTKELMVLEKEIAEKRQYLKNLMQTAEKTTITVVEGPPTKLKCLVVLDDDDDDDLGDGTHRELSMTFDAVPVADEPPASGASSTSPLDDGLGDDAPDSMDSDLPAEDSTTTRPSKSLRCLTVLDDEDALEPFTPEP